MLNIDNSILFLLVLFLPIIECDVVFLNKNANFSLADSMCKQKGGTLPLPLSEDDNQELAVTLASHGIKQTWLAIHLSFQPWINRDANQELTNQGCFSGDDFEYAYSFYGYRFTLSKCKDSCSIRGKKYLGIKTKTTIVGGQLEIACTCGSDTANFNQGKDSLCPTSCGEGGTEEWCPADLQHTAIYLAKDGGYLNEAWTENENVEITNADTCAKYRRGANSNEHMFVKFACSAKLAVRCISNLGSSPIEALQVMSWFAAKTYCSVRDAHLPGVNEAKGLSYLPEDTEIWTAMTARHWTNVTGDKKAKRIEYSNWSDAGSYTEDNLCASVNSFGNWIDNNCEDVMQDVFCITDSPDDEIIRFTTTTTTTIRAPTTSKVTPSSDGGGGDNGRGGDGGGDTQNTGEGSSTPNSGGSGNTTPATGGRSQDGSDTNTASSQSATYTWMALCIHTSFYKTFSSSGS